MQKAALLTAQPLDYKGADLAAGSYVQPKNLFKKRILVSQHDFGGAAGEPPPGSEKPDCNFLQAQFRF